MMHWRRWFAACAVVGSIGVTAVAPADWTGFRNGSHDGVTAETATWPKSGAPRRLWQVPVGEGFGAVAVAGGQAFLTAAGGGQEGVLALDANTGRANWNYEVGRTIAENQGGNGPRTTPAVDGGRVYVLGTYLKLVCLDAKTGRLLWEHDLTSEFGGEPQLSVMGIKQWGNAMSPLVDNGRVFVAGGGAGQTFLAFDAATGKVAWKTGDEKITHATPTIATIHGVRQVIHFTQSGLVSLATDDGRELWRYAYPFDVSTASTPVVSGDIVYCSAGYPKSVGSDAARITKEGNGFKAATLWKNRDKDNLCNHWTNPVVKDGYLYGLFGFKRYTATNKAPLKCVELATGKVMWEHPGFGPGGTILAGDNLVVQGDQGQVAIVKATPEKYTQVGGGQILTDGRCWNMAVVSGGRLYARNTKLDPKDRNPQFTGSVICLDLSTK